MKNLDKKATELIEKLGALTVNEEFNFRGYTHYIKTKCGLTYLKIDSEGSVFSLYCNHKDDDSVKRSKYLVGHWKYNYMEFKKGNSTSTILEGIENHLSFIL